MPLLPSGLTSPSPPRLPPEAAAMVRAELRRKLHGTVVVVFAEGELRVDDREQLVALYRRAGVRELVERLRRAEVPAGHVLGLVDLEKGARVVVLEVEALLGPAVDAAPAAPSCMLGGQP